MGNIIPVTHVSDHGVFRTGLWSEYASTDRYQTPSDPRTWVDAALPNFHEKFLTTTMQPFAEYELQVAPTLRITPGVKLAYYKQDFTQFADNGKTVGQPQRRTVHPARRGIPHLAAVDRRALSGAIGLVAVRPVRKGPEHSADAASST